VSNLCPKEKIQLLKRQQNNDERKGKKEIKTKRGRREGGEEKE
jgi:hypothetical protein